MSWVVICLQLNKQPTPTFKIHKEKRLSDKGLIDLSNVGLLQPVVLSVGDSASRPSTAPSVSLSVALPQNWCK